MKPVKPVGGPPQRLDIGQNASSTTSPTDTQQSAVGWSDPDMVDKIDADYQSLLGRLKDRGDMIRHWKHGHETGPIPSDGGLGIPRTLGSAILTGLYAEAWESDVIEVLLGTIEVHTERSREEIEGFIDSALRSHGTNFETFRRAGILANDGTRLASTDIFAAMLDLLRPLKDTPLADTPPEFTAAMNVGYQSMQVALLWAIAAAQEQGRDIADEPYSNYFIRLIELITGNHYEHSEDVSPYEELCLRISFQLQDEGDINMLQLELVAYAMMSHLSYYLQCGGTDGLRNRAKQIDRILGNLGGGEISFGEAAAAFENIRIGSELVQSGKCEDELYVVGSLKHFITSMLTAVECKNIVTEATIERFSPQASWRDTLPWHDVVFKKAEEMLKAAKERASSSMGHASDLMSRVSAPPPGFNTFLDQSSVAMAPATGLDQSTSGSTGTSSLSLAVYMAVSSEIPK